MDLLPPSFALCRWWPHKHWLWLSLETIFPKESPQTAVKSLSYLSLPLWTHTQASLEWAEASASQRVNKRARANSLSKGHEWTANHCQINSLFNSAYSYLNRAQAESSFCVLKCDTMFASRSTSCVFMPYVPLRNRKTSLTLWSLTRRDIINKIFADRRVALILKFLTHARARDGTLLFQTSVRTRALRIRETTAELLRVFLLL